MQKEEDMRKFKAEMEEMRKKTEEKCAEEIKAFRAKNETEKAPTRQ